MRFSIRLRAPLRFTLRFAGVCLLVGSAWWVASRWLVPSLIEDMYYERSLGVLNRVISGRGSHPLSRYLMDWRNAARVFDTALLLAMGFAYVTGLARLPQRLARFHRALEARERALHRSSHFRPADTLTLACGLGVLTGYSVAAYLLTKTFLLHEAAPGYRLVSRAIIWMAPAGDLVTFATVAGVLLVLGLLVRPLARRRVVAFVMLFLTALTLFMISGRLHPFAGVLLAAGVAYQGSRLVSAYWEELAPKLRRAGGAAILLIPMLGVGNRVEQVVSSRRAISQLPRVAAGAPNVLLLVLDTVRARNSSLLGYERATTPNLERLAATGATFERAIATSSWSLPSHASMLTGQYPREVGGDFITPLEERHVTLPGFLKERGYVTIGVVANLIFGTPSFGLDRGFVYYQAEVTTPAMVMSSSWLAEKALTRIRAWLGNHQSLVRRRATDVNGEFLAWIDTHPDRPFFAMLNYFDAHAPYRPPSPFDRMFMEGRLRYWLGDATSEDLSAEEISQLVAAYDGAIAYTDHVAGQLLEALAERGRLDETLVIVTADHGEEFGEHERFGHASSVHMAQVHVPLVVRFPAAIPAGIRISEPTSLADIPATVTRLLSLGDGHFPGVSLSRHWEGPEARAGHRSARHASPALSESIGQRSVVVGDLHYIEESGGEEHVYDIVADPYERQDMATSLDQAVLDRLRAALLAAGEADRTP